MRGVTYGAASTVLVLLPAAWLNWELQAPWKLLVPPAIVVTAWTLVGTLFGGVSLKVLSAILAPSWLAFEGAVRGMVLGFAIGALLAATCVFFRNAMLGDQSIDIVLLIHSGDLTGPSIWVGSLFAFFGSWAGAIMTGPRLTKQQRLRSTGSAGCNASRDRFQFGIARLLFLTASIAVIVAIPVQILARLRKIPQLVSHMIAIEVMFFLFAILALPFVAWATIRGPTAYASLVDAMSRWRELKHSDDALKASTSQEK